MADPARKLDETRVRAALSRLLVPALVDRVIEECSDEGPMPAPRPTREQIEAAARRLDERDKRRGRR